jgi:serine/threonine-protein kinase
MARFLPQRGRAASGPRESTPGLPTDLLGQSAGRLRAVALLYAFVYFFSGFFPALLFPDSRAILFATVSYWLPGAASIALALLMAAITRSRRVPLPLVMSMGLVFEVVSSYFIASAEFLLDARMADMLGHWMGLSWVAIWTLLFTIVVPTRPLRALLAAVASVAAVPVVVGFTIATRTISSKPGAAQFFFTFVFPYVLIVIMAYVAARVVYSLGTEVGRARELGSYQLVERLGQGGMGEVWLGKHSMLARPAAIKLIRPSLLAGGMSAVSDDMQRRFEREAQAIARLRSPHTVNLFDFGVAPDGSFYYVMELLEGLDADTLVRRHGPIPADRTIYLLRQVCHSLSEAESCGLVHRDIKPANIFLCRYGEEYDFVKVLDFGLAKAAHDSADSGMMTLTRDVVVRGTPAFIAPEQAMGAAEIDGRADIYAAGCVAYWLLTGRLVFTADTPMGLLLHHARTAPTPPSALTELPIPAALEQLVMSCLAKDPAHRPQSARELSRRLAELDGAGDWTQERAKAWWEMHEPN